MPLTFMGFISYPLYLIHENALVGFTVKVHNHLAFVPDMMSPLPGIAFIVVSAWIIAAFLEPRLKELLKIPLGMRIRRLPS